MDKLSQPFLDLLAKYTFVNITTMLKVPQSSKPAPLSPELWSSPFPLPRRHAQSRFPIPEKRYRRRRRRRRPRGRARGHTYMTYALGGQMGVPKSSQMKQNQLIYVRDKGGGGKNPTILRTSYVDGPQEDGDDSALTGRQQITCQAAPMLFMSPLGRTGTKPAYFMTCHESKIKSALGFLIVLKG